jgi:hypothetical protein
MRILNKSTLSKISWLSALLVFLLLCGLHWHFRHTVGGFWRDEVNVINLSRSHSLTDMAKDSFPLAMPLLLRLWAELGFSEQNLRWLGCLIGIGVMGALGFSSWKLRGTAPWFGLILLGLNSTLIVYGDSLRAYGLGCLGIIFTVMVAGIFLRKPGWKNSGWLALIAVFSVQTLFHNAVLVAAICAGVALVCLRRRAWLNVLQVLVSGLIAALSLLPYFSNILLGQKTSETLRTGFDGSQLLSAYDEAFGFPLLKYCVIWSVLVLIVISWSVRILLRPPPQAEASQSNESLILFAGSTMVFALAGSLLLLRLAALTPQCWYLLPLMAVLTCCLDFAWPVEKPVYAAILAVLVVFTVPLGIKADQHDLKYRFTNIDIWTQQMNQQVAPQDYIVVVRWFCGITFQYYFTGTNSWDTLPPVKDHHTHRYDLAKTQLQNPDALAPVFEKMTAALQGGHRVWVLDEHGWDLPPPGTPEYAPLPPPPLSKWGWSENPYTLVWISQVSHFLDNHSQRFFELKSPTEGQTIAEDMHLFVAEGWKTNSAANHP